MAFQGPEPRWSFTDETQPADPPDVERDRFTFMFRHGLVELLGADAIRGMEGQHVQFSLGDHTASGLIERVEERDEMFHVTMAVESPVGPGGNRFRVSPGDDGAVTL